MTTTCELRDTNEVNTARSLLLYIVGIAGTLLGVLLIPTPALAYDLGIVTEVLEYPARALTQIDNWGMGLENADSVPATVQDLTGQTVVEMVGGESMDLVTKLESTKTAVDNLQMEYQQMASETVLIGLKWDSLTVSEVTASIDMLIARIANTGQLGWLTSAWGWPQLDVIATKSNVVKSSLVTAKSILQTSGMQPVAYEQIKTAAVNLDAISTLIGEESDTLRDRTIYANYLQVIDEAGQWDKMSEQEDLVKKIKEINQIPKVEPLLALDPMAAILLNRKLMGGTRGSAQWITVTSENPMTFWVVVTNPSVLARQEVAVKYYLPAELTLEDIVKNDPGLVVKMDEDKKRLYVEGNLTVAAGDTRLVSVETVDIWKTRDLATEKIGQQADDIVAKLVDTKKYVQAVTLKSDIEAGIKEIVHASGEALRPYERIQSHRKAMVSWSKMQNDLAALQKLSDSSGLVLGWTNMGWGEFGYWREVGVVILGLVLVLIGGYGLAKSQGNGPGEARKPRPMRQFSVFSTHVDAADM